MALSLPTALLTGAGPSGAAPVGPVIATVAGSVDAGAGPSTTVGQAPTDVAVDGSRLLIADGLYGVIRAVDLVSGVENIVARLTPVHPPTETGPATAGQANPQSIVADGKGNMFVSRTLFAQVVEISADGDARIVAGSGMPGFAGDGGPATSARLSSPGGLALAPDGSVYVADTGNDVIRKIAPDGIITTVAGGINLCRLPSDPPDLPLHRCGPPSHSGDGGPAIAASLAYPSDVTLDAAGNLYIADSYNLRIRRVDPAGVITTVAGADQRPDPTQFGCATGGTASGAWIGEPDAVATDGAGGLVFGTWDCLYRISAAGAVSVLAGGDSSVESATSTPAMQSGFSQVSGIAVAPDGAVYVSGAGQVRRISAGRVDTVVGSATMHPEFGGVFAQFSSGDLRPARSAQLADVSSMVVAADGTTYLTDAIDGTLRAITADGAVRLISNAGGIPGVLGKPQEGGLVADNPLGWAGGLALDSSGQLLFTDSINGEVMRIGTDARLTRIAGGQPQRCDNNDGDGGPATLATLADPDALVTDTVGDIYILERSSGRVREVTPDGQIHSVVRGRIYKCDGTSSGTSVLYLPTGMAPGPDGTLWVTDGNCLNAVSPAGDVSCVEKLAVRPFDLSPSQYNDWSIGQYSAVTVQPDGTVIYTDTYAHQVLARAPDGTVSALAGTGQLGCAADGVPAASATLSLPSALAIDRSGHLLVADAACHQISAIGADLPTRLVQRLAGPDRLVTGVEIARASYRPGQARGAVLARAGAFPDALAGAPLAAHVGGPLLLTARDALSAWTESQLRLSLPAGATVYVLGGTSALSPNIDARLRQLGFQVVRYAGLDRFATAVAIAQQGLASSTATLLTTGLDFPDALAASAAAASTGAAVLLTAGPAMPTVTATYLAQHAGSPSYAVGGPATIAAPDALALAGSDRYATATTLARHFFPHPSTVAIATGTGFADALTGAAAIAMAHGPLLLTSPTALAVSTENYLRTVLTPATATYVYGGVAAVSDTLAAHVAALKAATAVAAVDRGAAVPR